MQRIGGQTGDGVAISVARTRSEGVVQKAVEKEVTRRDEPPRQVSCSLGVRNSTQN